MYQLLYDGTVYRVADGAAIPPDSDNIDYQAYLAWVKKGNKAQPYVPPASPAV